MEVFLLCSIPRKRKHNRLKLVVKRLSNPLLATHSLPDTLGRGFWPIGLYQTIPLTYGILPKNNSLALFVKKSPFLCQWATTCINAEQVFLDQIGYKWEVQPNRSDQTGQSRPDRCSQMVDETPEPTCSSHTVKFEFGKGMFMEVLPDDQAQLRNHLNRLLAESPELTGHEFRLQYDEGIDRITLATSIADGQSETWTIDVKSWTVIGAQLEDWFAHRLRAVLADRQNPIEQFITLVHDIFEGVSVHLMVAENLVANMKIFQEGSEPIAIDGELLPVARATMEQLLKHLLLMEKYVAVPISQVLQKRKRIELVEGHKKENPLARTFDHTPGFNCHIRFGQLIKELSNFKAFCQIQSLTDCFPRSPRILKILKTGDFYDLGFGFEQWTKVISTNSSASNSLIRRLKKLADAFIFEEIPPLKVTFGLQKVQHLHNEVLKTLRGPLRDKLAGFGRQCFPVVDKFPNPLSGTNNFEVVWMLKISQDDLCLHLKSRSNPQDQFILHINGKGKQEYHAFPMDSVDYFPDPLVSKFRAVDRIVSKKCVWIVNHPKGLKDSELFLFRINLNYLNGYSNSLFHYCRWDVKGSFKFYKETHLILDEAFLFIDFQHIKYENPSLNLHLVGTNKEGELLNVPEPLLDMTCPTVLARLNHSLPPKIDSALNITSTAKDCLFLRFSIGATISHQKQQEPQIKQTIGLMLYELSLKEKSYKLLHFNTWQIINPSINLHSNSRSLSTFKAGPAEYFLICHQNQRLMLQFDCHKMSLVLVDRNAVHRIPKEIGQPAKLLGFDKPRDSIDIFYRTESHAMSTQLKFTLFRVKYVLK